MEYELQKGRRQTTKAAMIPGLSAQRGLGGGALYCGGKEVKKGTTDSFSKFLQ